MSDQQGNDPFANRPQDGPSGPPPGYSAPPPGQGPQGYGPQGYGGEPPYNTLAVVGFVLAFVFAIAGLVVGIIARGQIKKTGERGAGLALAAIIISAVQIVLVVLAIVAVVLFAVVGTGVSTSSTSIDVSTLEPGAVPPGVTIGEPGPAGLCTYSGDGAPSRDVGLPPSDPARLDGTVGATIVTSAGDVTVTLDPAAAPCTVNSFTHLAQASYFDDTSCHRLTTAAQFGVLQCGDPDGTGSGGPGYVFDDENLEGATYPAGTLAMANAGPSTNGSQFFLVYADTRLSPDYTPFGQVTGGLEVLRAIADKGTGDGSPDGAPAEPVVIATITVNG